eukprot:CAMPEP_0113680866 /NCGR_PEP_ID=MMETSP0038_2-20120614/11607_1 /TAXON_ID=2898 /ORGANISM="Cryptomonas paramecium" /LENGTH=80 /DNA_ID=CAMNT_0000599395 /DNA_START=20 /DNA_END=262 /DNA_ORIENTATION=+ /assembly_acc=CAM_ASM_000170
MAARGSLMRLIPKVQAASPLRTVMPIRGGHGHGHGGPDPNAPKWEQAVRRVLWNDEHVVFAVLGGWVAVYYGVTWSLKKK